jgi:hypothetical protein
MPLVDTSTSSIGPNSKEAGTIRKTEVFIWVKVPMAPSYARKTVDIPQVLPVVRFANKPQLIAASLKSSELWPYFKVTRLHQNMRTGSGEEEFAEWLLKLGNGELPSNWDVEFGLRRYCILDSNLVNEIFGPQTSIENVSAPWNKTILCPNNEDSSMPNEEVLQRLSEQENCTQVLMKWNVRMVRTRVIIQQNS